MKPTYCALSAQLRSVSLKATDIAGAFYGLDPRISSAIEAEARVLMSWAKVAERRMIQDPLPKGQARVLEFVRRYLAEHGKAPTRSEIARALKFSSANSEQEHLNALHLKGHLSVVAGEYRGIRIKAVDRHRGTVIGCNPCV